MRLLSTLGGIVFSRPVLFVVLVALGIGVGYAVFFHVYPKTPKIGIIDIPYTVINDRSATRIVSYLEYARNRDDIKGVVIRISSPGGGASSSERLFLETRNLRDEKPVVMVMGDLVASGGYMMSMGANYLYTRPSSLVGNVGVIVSYPGPTIPFPPLEFLVITGPDKLFGGDRRDWLTMADEIKHSFAGIVINERGSSLKLTKQELLTGRVYPGIGAVNVGLADAIGGDTDAVETAAELAGVSHYDVVNINAQVERRYNEVLRWVYDPLLLEFPSGDTGSQFMGRVSPAPVQNPSPSSESTESEPAPAFGTDLEALRNILPYGGIGPGQEEALPGFPQKISPPNVYYLYVGPSQ